MTSGSSTSRRGEPTALLIPPRAGFDSVTDDAGRHRVFAAWDRGLHTIDLATGRATPAGAVRPVVSLAVVADEPG